MHTQQKPVIDLRAYKDLIETVAKVEYSKLSSGTHLVDYQELVNLNTHTLYILFKNGKPEDYNNAYISTAMKWAIRNEIRRRYRWYSLKQKKLDMESGEELRAAVYKSILSIEEMADSDNPTQIKDSSKNPEENYEFFQLKNKIMKALETIPEREKEFIEQKFFKDKKLREMAVEYKISESRISRIIQTGLNRIKKQLSEQGIIEWQQYLKKI